MFLCIIISYVKDPLVRHLCPWLHSSCCVDEMLTTCMYVEHMVHIVFDSYRLFALVFYITSTTYTTCILYTRTLCAHSQIRKIPGPPTSQTTKHTYNQTNTYNPTITGHPECLALRTWWWVLHEDVGNIEYYV